MSAPAHVGDCDVMTFTRRSDGALIADRPWERFAVMEFTVMQDATGFIHRLSDQAMEYIDLTVENGWARYRIVGRDFDKHRAVCELVSSEYTAV